MLHRALLGSVERFLGVLIEHFAGAFPIWLAPVQVMVIPIAERHQEYGKRVLAQLADAGLRAELDDRNEKMGYKIREAQTQKIPYMLVVVIRRFNRVRFRCGIAIKGRGAQSLESFLQKIKDLSKPGPSGHKGPEADFISDDSLRRITITIKQIRVRVNELIRAKEIRVIDEDGGNWDHDAGTGAGNGAFPGIGPG